MPSSRYGQYNVDIPKKLLFNSALSWLEKDQVERLKNKIAQCPQFLWQMPEHEGVLDSRA